MKTLYENEQMEQACKKIKEMLPDSDAIDQTGSSQYSNTEISHDFTRKDLKRIIVSKCKFIDSKFNGAAATGSKFSNTIFLNCDFSGANFQYCYFLKSSFTEKSLARGTNFSHSVFIDCTFHTSTIIECTLFDCLFENCTFRPLLEPVFLGGELVKERVGTEEIRQYVRWQLKEEIWEEEQRFVNPHVHYLDMTPAYYKMKTELLKQAKE